MRRPAVDLTPIQRKVVLRYRGFRDRPPTLVRIPAPALPRWLILLGLVLLSAYVVPVSAAAFYAGMVVGAIILQTVPSVQAWRVFPALVEILDWKKVDQLLGISSDEEF